MSDTNTPAPETSEADDLAALEAALAQYGPGDPIGRWGPVQAFKGRTIGEPCQGMFDACDDYDVDIWLAEAKSWTQYARSQRDELIVPRWGSATSEWPRLARLGEHAYERAREVLAGDLGYLDGSKVQTLQVVQRWSKVALELYTRAVVDDVGKNVDMHNYDRLTHDTITEPMDRPTVVPPPRLPGLPPIGLYLKIGAAAVVGLTALGVASLFVRRTR